MNERETLSNHDFSDKHKDVPSYLTSKTADGRTKVNSGVSADMVRNADMANRNKEKSLRTATGILPEEARQVRNDTRRIYIYLMGVFVVITLIFGVMVTAKLSAKGHLAFTPRNSLVTNKFTVKFTSRTNRSVSHSFIQAMTGQNWNGMYIPPMPNNGDQYTTEAEEPPTTEKEQETEKTTENYVPEETKEPKTKERVTQKPKIKTNPQKTTKEKVTEAPPAETTVARTEKETETETKTPAPNEHSETLKKTVKKP